MKNLAFNFQILAMKRKFFMDFLLKNNLHMLGILMNLENIWTLEIKNNRANVGIFNIFLLNNLWETLY